MSTNADAKSKSKPESKSESKPEPSISPEEYIVQKALKAYENSCNYKPIFYTIVLRSLLKIIELSLNVPERKDVNPNFIPPASSEEHCKVYQGVKDVYITGFPEEGKEGGVEGAEVILHIVTESGTNNIEVERAKGMDVDGRIYMTNNAIGLISGCIGIFGNECIIVYRLSNVVIVSNVNPSDYILRFPMR